jgi:nucleotide-binding universal stress UspA family protein
MSVHRQTSSHRIVVGVDGSASSKAALAWAIRQAELTGATVEAVIAWHSPVMVGGYGRAPVTATEPDFEAVSGYELGVAIAETVDPASEVKVTATVREGGAARVLLDASHGADLLVVGSRGHGGFTGALLGSVSQHCVHHATCPVVIIRTDQTS